MGLALFEKNIIEFQELEMGWNLIRDHVPPLENVLHPIAAEISLLSAEIIYEKIYEMAVIRVRKNTNSTYVLSNAMYERAYQIPYLASVIRGTMTLYLEGIVLK